MSPFDGFPEGKIHLTPVPAPFFAELLPEIDHLGELKLTLYAFWRLDRMEGTFRYLLRSDFCDDSRFMIGMGHSAREAEAALDDALERAVLRGSLLKVTAGAANGEEDYYFLNSPKGRAAIAAMEQGRWAPGSEVRLPVELNMERPNIFKLYEENIGPLTPMLAESLRDAEETYPLPWIQDAIRVAVENNKRSWRYVDAILRRWQEEGRDEPNRRRTEKDPRGYADWETS